MLWYLLCTSKHRGVERGHVARGYVFKAKSWWHYCRKCAKVQWDDAAAAVTSFFPVGFSYAFTSQKNENCLNSAGKSTQNPKNQNASVREMLICIFFGIHAHVISK